MLKLIAFLCLISCVLAGTSLVRPHLDGRIVGGNSTTIDQFPHQVSLFFFGNYLCGGSIISDQWVLTAGHCIGYPAFSYLVRAGSSSYNSGGSLYFVSSVINHPNYVFTSYDYDIALVKISGTFTFGPNVQAIKLASTAPEVGTLAVVTGWGATKEGGSSVSTLQYVEVPIVSRLSCIVHNIASVTSRMICAGYTDGGHDACQGDSGGALVADGVQVGIVSWGIGCARPNLPGVYTNVANLRDWISTSTGV